MNLIKQVYDFQKQYKLLEILIYLLIVEVLLHIYTLFDKVQKLNKLKENIIYNTFKQKKIINSIDKYLDLDKNNNKDILYIYDNLLERLPDNYLDNAINLLKYNKNILNYSSSSITLFNLFNIDEFNYKRYIYDENNIEYYTFDNNKYLLLIIVIIAFYYLANSKYNFIDLHNNIIYTETSESSDLNIPILSDTSRNSPQLSSTSEYNRNVINLSASTSPYKKNITLFSTTSSNNGIW